MVKSLAVLALLLLTTAAEAQPLSDAEVLTAIGLGTKGTLNDSGFTCGAGAGMMAAIGDGMTGGVTRNGSYTLVVAGPIGLIARHTARAKRLYETFGVEQVTAEMRAPVMTVTVEPQEPKRSSNVIALAAVIQKVVVRSKSKTVVVQPASFTTEPVEWKNLAGAVLDGNRAIATFELTAMKELGKEDADIVILTPQGERKCGLSVKDFTTKIAKRP